jgi:lipoprotein-releasing system ATP-binding protein
MQSLKQNLTHDDHSPAVMDTLRAKLHVVDLRKSFVSPTGSRIEVLRGASLEVKPGEVVAIVGASGSGKSTLLHLLGGLDEADHGSISVEDTELSSLGGDSKARFRQKHIGFVFQFHYLMNDLSALENVALPLLIARLGWKESRRQASILLNEFGLEKRKDHAASQLSGGEQQRVALARALIHSPRLLLADEPTGNLDTVIGDEIGRTVVEYVRSRGTMAIIATHNETLASLCDRTQLLENGRLKSI